MYIYGAIGISGAALISGGIYAFYAQRQINALRKRNIRLSNKISKIEGVIKGLSKDNVSFGKELANNVSLAMENRKYIEALGGNFDELANLVEEQAEKINTVSQKLESFNKSGGKAFSFKRRRIGFSLSANKTADKVAERQLKNLGKGGILGLITVGVLMGVYMSLVSGEASRAQAAVSNKRAAFKRYLDKAYKNDEGFFIFDVLALSSENRTLTASILYENIGKTSDYYKLFSVQRAAAEKAAKEIGFYSAESNKRELIGLIKNEEKAGKMPMPGDYKNFKPYLNAFAL